MTDLTNVKVGDKLFVKVGYYDKGQIIAVDRVTPTGRVITKVGQFNPDGRRRGDSGWERASARPATEDDIAGIYRHGLVRALTEFRHWEKMTAADLKAAADLIAKYKAA